jgi:hypothetical protein
MRHVRMLAGAEGAGRLGAGHDVAPGGRQQRLSGEPSPHHVTLARSSIASASRVAIMPGRAAPSWNGAVLAT